MTSFLVIAAILLVAISVVTVLTIRRKDIHGREAQTPTPPSGQTPTEEDVIRLARAGQKIAAIKLHREIHGTGLKESRDAVEALADGNPIQTAPTGSPVSDSSSADAEVLRLARAGQKIEAIKLYREIHGVGLADAKAAVEDLPR